MKQYLTPNSKVLYDELNKYLLDGVASSFHKASYEEYPLGMAYGKGSKLYDVDGNEYIDYIQGLGPMILGYSPEALNQAVIDQINKGSHYATPTENLLKLSKKLVEIIPCAEMVSYQNTGTEANLFAFRMARAYTGKDKIIKFEGHYHGWADEQKLSIDAEHLSQLGARNRPNKIIHSHGQLPITSNDIIVLPWNDIALLTTTIERYKHEIAGVIMEPLMCDSGPILPQPGYLQEVRALTKANDVLLIFDEVITGFRASLGGAQAHYGVIPDLAVFAKAIAGGYPLSVIAGQRDIMTCGAHASGTFNANPISVAAALATIEELERPGTYDHLNEMSRILVNGIKDLGKKYNICLFTDYVGSICILEFGIDHPFIDFRDCLSHIDYHTYDKVVKMAKSYGIRLTPKRGRLYISKAHTISDIQKTLDVFDYIFANL